MLSIKMVESLLGVTLVKLILRNKEYEVKPGMTLLSALQKIDVIPESVIATRDGEMILEDEILRDGDVVKLIAVISGGSCRCKWRRWLSSANRRVSKPGAIKQSPRSARRSP